MNLELKSVKCRIMHCISYFCITVTKDLTKTTYRREDLFWLRISESSVHSGLAWWQGRTCWCWRCVLEERFSPLDIQEAENGEYRKRPGQNMARRTRPQWPTSSKGPTPYCSPPQSCHPIMSLSKWLIHWLDQSPHELWKRPQRHTQRCALPISACFFLSKPTKLTIRLD
jgi:hypothetical protein